MSEQSPKQYLAMLQRSELVPIEQLRASIGELTRNSGAGVTLDQVSEHLIRGGLITAWHDEKLRAGKYRGFFLGKYKLLGHLGSGGMCSVYLAEHTMLRQPRAIKVLPKSRVADKSYLERFYREGRAAASLSHPNIVRVYDIDNDGENHYLVMEYVEGMNLYDLVKNNGPLGYPDAADFILQAAIGLQHAHDVKLVHRDVKPANLLVTRGNIIKVLDLGLAMFSEEEHSLTITHNERVLGTADYLAPEQAVNSHEVDHRADIYGLGCSLYYLLTGNPPFPEGTLAERIAMHQNAKPKSVEAYRADCPRELLHICQKMMHKDRTQRYQTCRDAAAHLRMVYELLVPGAEPNDASLERIRKPAIKSMAAGEGNASAGVAVATRPHQPVRAAQPTAGNSAPAAKPTNGPVASSNGAGATPVGKAAAPKPAAARPVAPKPAARQTPDQKPSPFPLDAKGPTAAVAASELSGLPVVPAHVSRIRRGKSLKQQILLWSLVAALLLILGLTVYLAIQYSPAPTNPG